MSMLRAKVTTYTVHLTRPLQIAGYTIPARHIAGVTLSDDVGIIGYGEVSPLPGLHGETFDQAVTQLQTVADEINRTSMLPVPDALYPSVRLGLDMAVCDKSLRSEARARVKLNALIGTEGKVDVHQLLEQGYTCIKLKVGGDNIEHEVDRIRAIRDILQHRARIRLDANRRWSLEQAVRFGRTLGREGIEYIEEPTKTSAEHSEFYCETGIPFAWDESLLHGEPIPQPGLAALVIKPARLGALDTAEHWIAWAKAKGKQAVISSVFESCRCLAFYARYCAAKDLLDTHHGLDTWRWLKDDPYQSKLKVRLGGIEL